MNTIKLTHNDLQAMINEAVKRTLAAKGVLSEGYRPQSIVNRTDRTSPKWSPYKQTPIWGGDIKPKWFDDEGEMAQFDNEAVEQSIKEDIEDFKSAIGQIAEHSLALVKWAMKKGARLEYLKKPFDRFMSASVGRSGAEEAKLYFEAKGAESKEFPWDLAIAFTQMSPEEQEADIQEYLVPALIDKYQSKYGKYQGEFEAAAARRGEIEGGIADFMKKFADTDPSQMSYVELIEAKDAIYEFADKYDAYNRDAEPFFQERGLNWSELRKAIGQEIKERYDSVPHFRFCENDKTYSPEYKARYEAQMKEYKELMAKTNAHSLKQMERSASPGESIRGFNWSSNEMVDDNGELVCTVRFEVDSSD